MQEKANHIAFAFALLSYETKEVKLDEWGDQTTRVRSSYQQKKRIYSINTHYRCFSIVDDKRPMSRVIVVVIS